MKVKSTRRFVRRPRMRRIDVKAEEIRFDNLELIQKLTSPTGQILPRRLTGLTAKNQRKVSREIKRSRNFGLVAYCTDDVRSEA